MHGAVFWEIFIPVAAFVFILPTLVGVIRGADNITAVILFNVFALVSFGVGWIAALGFACIGKRAPTRGGPRKMRSVREARPPRRQVPDPDYNLDALRGTPFESLAGHMSAARLEK